MFVTALYGIQFCDAGEDAAGFWIVQKPLAFTMACTKSEKLLDAGIGNVADEVPVTPDVTFSVGGLVMYVIVIAVGGYAMLPPLFLRANSPCVAASS